MNLQIEFKKNIYTQIARQFNCNLIKHSVAHGIDYADNHYGRDADIMILYKDRKIVRKIISSVFEQNEIQFKDWMFLWGNWIFGYKMIDNRIFFIEIDLIYHVYYRCFELTSNKELSINKVNTDCFYIDYWNMYAKVVLLKFLGLDFHSLSDKHLKEITRIVNLYTAYNIIPNKFFSNELLSNLNQAIIDSDFQGVSDLKSKIKPINIIRKNPIKSFIIFLKMSSYVVNRKMKAFGVFPVTMISGRATDHIKQLRALLNESFFTKVTVTDETLNIPSIGRLLKIYIKIRKKWKPMDLNIVIMNDKALKIMSSNFFIRLMFKWLNVLIIDADKENIQTNDILLKILKQTVKK